MALKDSVEFTNPSFKGKTRKNLLSAGDMCTAWMDVAQKWRDVVKAHSDDEGSTGLWQTGSQLAYNTANGGFVPNGTYRHIGTYNIRPSAAYSAYYNFEYASVVQYAPANTVFATANEGIGTGTQFVAGGRYTDYAGGNITYNVTCKSLRDFLTDNGSGLKFGAVPTTIDYDSEYYVPRWHITGYDIDTIISKYGDYLVPVALDVVDKMAGNVLISYNIAQTSMANIATTVDSLSSYRAYDWCGVTRGQLYDNVIGYKKSKDYSATNPATPYDLIGYCSEGLSVFMEQIKNWRLNSARMTPIFNNSVDYDRGLGVGIWFADTADNITNMGYYGYPYRNTYASLIAWRDEDAIIEYMQTNVGFGVTFADLDKALDPDPDPGNVDDDGLPTNPTDDGDGDGDNTSDPINYPDPTVLPTSGRQFYALTGAQVGQLRDFIFSDTFLDNVKRLWTEPGDYIIDISYYPIDLTTTGLTWGSASKIAVGGVESDISAPELLGGKPYIYMGEYTIGNYYNSYLDYAPYTRLDIFLPYIGLRPLDINQVMGHKIRVGYYLDYATQKVLAAIGLDGTGTSDLGRPIAQYTGDIGVHVPLSGQSAQQLLIGTAKQIGGLVGSVGSIVGGAMTGNAGAIIGGAAGAVSNLIPEQVSRREYGSMTAVTGIYTPQQCFLIVDRPIAAEPKDFKNKLGYSASYGAQISEFSGFLQCSQCDIEPTGTMSREECNEIINLLRGGIFI